MTVYNTQSKTQHTGQERGPPKKIKRQRKLKGR